MAETESYTHGMVKYSSRDYDSLKREFWDLVPKLTELWKPEAESDPGVVIGKFIASVADMLGVNVDWVANEVYAPSVSQRKNAEKIFGLIGYDLGWYTAARTEVTFTNARSDEHITIDFGFNGSNFATLNAYTDITNQSRVITYNVLPRTGALTTRSRRQDLTEYPDVFATSDKVELAPGESVKRVAIEGELRNYTISVADIKKNNYVVRLPSQHIDTTAIWVKAKRGSDFIDTQWVQCSSPAEFIQPEPRFAVTYDNYSNAQVQISNYINNLENYSGNSLVIYWVDCSGVIGSVGTDVLTNFMPAQPTSANVSLESGDISISNLSNTLELPNTATITGRSPETAKEAYYNSRNYINTWDSLITLPDFNRFLNREPGVDCGVVIDCQKALDINLAIYNDTNLTDSQKAKMYITNRDFPAGEPIFNWGDILGFDPENPNDFVFNANFKTYTAMCFAVHNNFEPSNWGLNQLSYPKHNNRIVFTQYKPPTQFIQNVVRDYRPLQAMSVQLEFGYARIFNFYVVGTITPTKPVTSSVAKILIQTAKEALKLHFYPANRRFGVKPTLMEIIDVIEGCDTRIRHFDPGAGKVAGILWRDCDIEYFNPISYARYVDDISSFANIKVNPEYIKD